MGSLQAATQDRKSRLAKFAGIKRKQPESSEDNGNPNPTETEEADVTKTYLSGRNYDPETRGPKLGFENNPDSGLETLEIRAAALQEATREEAAKETEADAAQVDIFKLQPKKPNWDLKRDLKERMEVLDIRTGNAIARLVKERLESARKAENGQKLDEAVPMEGGELLSAVHAAEEQAEEEAKKARDDEETA